MRSGTEEEVLIVLGPGEDVGEGALLGDAPHGTGGRAASALTVLEWDVSDVREALDSDARAATKVLTRVARVMSRRLQYAGARRLGMSDVYRPAATRSEHDLLGGREVPFDALFGVQTLRSVESFDISGASPPVVRRSPWRRRVDPRFPRLCRSQLGFRGSFAQRDGALLVRMQRSPARWDLRGGRPVRDVPTAITASKKGYCQHLAPRGTSTPGTASARVAPRLAPRLAPRWHP